MVDTDYKLWKKKNLLDINSLSFYIYYSLSFNKGKNIYNDN